MNEERLPGNILEGCLPGRRRRRKGRLRNSWMQEVTTGMKEKVIINNMEWIDRMDKRNKTLGKERCENIDTLYINKIIINNNNYYYYY